METSGFPPPVPAALSLEERLLRMEGELSTHKQQLSTHSRLLHCFAERDVIILAAEILKWAVEKRGDHNVEDGRQLYGAAVRPKVLLAARAYGEYGRSPTSDDVQHFKTMSRAVILLRNKTAHFEDLSSLEGLVKSCKIAIDEWPSLEANFPRQVKIIRNYREFKRLLPGMFQ